MEGDCTIAAQPRSIEHLNQENRGSTSLASTGLAPCLGAVVRASPRPPRSAFGQFIATSFCDRGEAQVTFTGTTSCIEAILDWPPGKILVSCMGRA
jgi:hypothetical protein